MQSVSRWVSVLMLVAIPAAAVPGDSSGRSTSPGTVYRLHREQGTVHVMDHQERIFVVSTQHPALRCRNRNIPGHQLRTGDKVWFSTVAYQ